MPMPTTRLQPALPPKLDEILHKCLDKDRKLRYQSATDLETDLARLKRDSDSSRTAVGISGPLTTSKPLSRGRVAVGLLAAAILVLVVGGLWIYRSTGGRASIDSVAVMPLSNESADAESEYLSDGITESLINSLSRLPNLKVKSRDSVFRYKG